MTTDTAQAAFLARCDRARHMFDDVAAANEAARLLDTAWYREGNYKRYGCDRYGVTYVTVEDDGDDYMEALEYAKAANEAIIQWRNER